MDKKVTTVMISLKRKKRKLPLLLVLILLLSAAVTAGVSYGGDQAAAVSEDAVIDIAPGQVDSTLAKLSDEEVRKLLIAELSKDIDKGDEPKKASGLVYKARRLLRLLDPDKSTDRTFNNFQTILAPVVQDYAGIPRKLGNGSIATFFSSLALLCGLFFLAGLVEFSVRRFSANFSEQFQENVIPELDGPMRFLAGVMRSIPSFIHIAVFVAAATFLFFVLPFDKESPIRYLFLAILFTIGFHRFLTLISRIIFAPRTPALRVVPLDDQGATSLHRWTLLICTPFFAAVMFVAMIMELRVSATTFVVTVISLASLIITLIIISIFRSRQRISEHILQQSEKNDSRNWAVEQFARFWHVPTIIYLLGVWIILVNSQLAGVQQGKSAFLLSLLVPLLFVLFDTVSQWVIRNLFKSLRISQPDDEEATDEKTRLEMEEAREREKKIILRSGRFVRLTILFALMVWAANLWGYHFPFAFNFAQAVFESMVAVALGLTAWRFASSYIEKKLAETVPEGEDDKKEDDEFGGAVQRGRGYTVLPMVRKVTASTLIVMVSLVILSSFGVNIGPLLAGAGVVGIAVGFGAQKLVSDILSGFFYLLDDAFRVGEYIQAGSVSGAVESITLRNVMLRHHRGMLQIVPHSQLGSITNFMRGGIIVKFNLEFPYDANVEKIRKVIKKVGKKMLQEEEFAKDFIMPIKSAGVREITGSVMTIRVKFKAQPGTHFVIRREAYRRITEALNAQGIYYAHRKVIVELPEGDGTALPEEKKKLLEAGAAAELDRQEEEQEKKAAGQANEKPGMPGM